MEAYLICYGDCDCIIATTFVSSYPQFSASDWNQARPIVAVPYWPTVRTGESCPPCPVCNGPVYVRLKRWTETIGKHHA